MKISVLSLAGLLAVIALPSTVDAKTVKITYTGSVKSGFDETGEFGAANSSLDGKSYKAIYTFDDATPGIYTDTFGTFFKETYGGINYLNVSPVSALLTINGIAQSFSGVFNGIAHQENEDSSLDKVYHYVEDYNPDGDDYYHDTLYNYIYSYPNNIVDSIDLTGPLNYAVQDQDHAYGYAKIFHKDYVDDTGLRYAYANLSPQSVTITAVPEAPTWMTMIAGCGCVGVALRRRKSKQALAQAL